VLQSEHLSLLVGSGFTTVGVLAGVIATAMEPITLTFKNETILPGLIDAHARLSAKDVGRGSSNLEDQIRSALGLLTGLEVLGDARVSMLRDGVNELLTTRSVANHDIGSSAGSPSSKEVAALRGEPDLVAVHQRAAVEIDQAEGFSGPACCQVGLDVAAAALMLSTQ
jgi:hypothetical protein